MKALIFDEPKKPVVTQVQSPRIDDNEVLIRSRRVGICHSDYELLAGQYIIPISYPVIPGHEWVGEVVEAGTNVTALQPGDRVVGECVINTPERIHHFGFSMDGANREYFRRAPGMAAQAARRGRRRQGRADRALHLRLLRRAAQRRHQRVRNRRRLRRRHHRPGDGRRRHRHGRAGDRGRSRAAAPRHRQAARRRRDRRLRPPATRSRRCRS